MIMIAQGNTRVFVSIREGKIEIEGSEEFVASQLTPLKAVIDEISKATGNFNEKGSVHITKQVAGKISSFEKYAKLFSANSDGDIELLKDLPGNNMKHKTMSAALLVSYANSLLGAEQTSLEVIRKVCKEKSCHDSNNFSATIKLEKELFSHSESSYIKLSDTGRQLAKNMAEQLIRG
jgi:hypothetical protein